MLESNQLTLGKMTDKTTGVTTATPYFQLIGSGNTGIPNYDDNYVYDSLTLVFPFNASTKILAGDTATLQTYRVYRLKNFPLRTLTIPVSTTMKPFHYMPRRNH